MKKAVLLCVGMLSMDEKKIYLVDKDVLVAVHKFVASMKQDEECDHILHFSLTDKVILTIYKR